MMDRLNEILSTMDIPKNRRDTTQPQNLRWLLRNMAIVNRHHPDFDEAVRIIKGNLSYYIGE